MDEAGKDEKNAPRPGHGLAGSNPHASVGGTSWVPYQHCSFSQHQFRVTLSKCGPKTHKFLWPPPDYVMKQA